MGKKWPKNGEKMGFGVIFLFFGHFFAISGQGPFSIFWPILSHFWISACFPFYTRRPDSQGLGSWMTSNLRPQDVRFSLRRESLTRSFLQRKRVKMILAADPEGPNLEKNQSRLNAWKFQAFAWNFQSRLKTSISLEISISTLKTPHNNRGVVGGSLEIFNLAWKCHSFQSRLQISMSCSNPDFFRDLGPLGNSLRCPRLR